MLLIQRYFVFQSSLCNEVFAYACVRVIVFYGENIENKSTMNRMLQSSWHPTTKEMNCERVRFSFGELCIRNQFAVLAQMFVIK